MLFNLRDPRFFLLEFSRNVLVILASNFEAETHVISKQCIV